MTEQHCVFLWNDDIFVKLLKMKVCKWGKCVYVQMEESVGDEDEDYFAK